MVRVTLPEVWDVSGVPPRGPKRVTTTSRRSGMVRETLPEVWDESGDPSKSLVWVGGPSRWYETRRDDL